MSDFVAEKGKGEECSLVVRGIILGGLNVFDDCLKGIEVVDIVVPAALCPPGFAVSVLGVEFAGAPGFELCSGCRDVSVGSGDGCVDVIGTTINGVKSPISVKAVVGDGAFNQLALGR